MKPPPRKRTKPGRHLNREPEPEPSSPKRSGQWQRAEQRRLLKALKTLHKVNRGEGELDCEFLRQYLPTRSTSEIHSVVEYLKDKAISSASFQLNAERLEEKKRKPIQVWTNMASAVAGSLEESISTAFSQMLIVASTEPCTLRNSDPPQIHRPPEDKDKPVGRTVPLRPMPRLPVKVESPGTNTTHPVLVLKTPGPATSPANRLPAPTQEVRVQNSKVPPPQQWISATAGASTSQSAAPPCQPGAAEILVPPAKSPQPAPQTVTPVPGRVTASSGSAAELKTQSVGSSLIQTTQQPSEQQPTTNSPSKSTSAGPHASLSSSATGPTPVPSTAPPSGSSSTAATPPLSTPAADFHTRFGRTSKYATKDSPRILGVKSVVDFERIYCYMSGIPQPSEECHLTPMESAIMLDLLMSLPEELPLLDCNKLHKHLIQVYQFLSTTADSKTAGEMFTELKAGLYSQTDAASSQGGFRTESQQSAAGTSHSSGVTDDGGKKLQSETESQSSGSNTTSGQSGDADVMTWGCPPLNPFMVPVKLLMRK